MTQQYVIVEPSTTEEIDARIYNSLFTEDHTFSLTGVRILDDLAAKRDKPEKRTFVCVIDTHHPIPRNDYYVVATLTNSQEAIRIETHGRMLKATVTANDPAPSP